MNSEELLAEYVQEIMLDIMERIELTDLTKDEKVDILLEEVSELLRTFGLTVTQLMPQVIIEAYFGSVDEATQLLAASGVPIATTSALTTTAAAGAVGAGVVVSKPFQKKIHNDAVASLITESLSDLQAAVRTAQLSGVTTIDKTLEAVKKDMVQGRIQGNNRKAITAKVMQTFREEGFTAFYDKNGHKIPLDSYAMTVVRTKTREAAVQGSTNRYTDSGQDLVQIIENSDTCPICARFRDMVVSLKGKTPGYPVVGEKGVRLPPLHPNCRGSIRPFVISFKTEDEIAAAKKRNSLYAEDKDVRTEKQRKQYAAEQKARRKANEEKKQFMRWQMLLGADAPKTLGAFRSMKRGNTLKFQELQSLYLSAARTVPKEG